MRKQHLAPDALLVILAVFFSGLLLTTAVLPTVMSVTAGLVIATPVPVEEEQTHGREVLKTALHDNGAWDGRACQLRQKIQAAFRHWAESLPVGPVSDVLLPPPKGI